MTNALRQSLRAFEFVKKGADDSVRPKASPV